MSEGIVSWCHRHDEPLDQAATHCEWLDEFHHCDGCANNMLVGEHL